MSKARIALVYDAIYPFVKGGGERRFYELGTRMAAMGYDVHWYGMKFWDGPSVRAHDGITLHGICKARPFYTKSGRRSISQALIFGLSCFKLLWAKFDVIDCCGFPYFSLFPAKLAALLHRKPLYATWHEVWGRKYWNEYLGKLGILGYSVERVASHLPNLVISTSDHTSRLLKNQLGVRNSVVVPNGIALDYIESVKPASNKSDIIYVGRLVSFKNVHLIIEALAYLKSQGRELACTIIGDGPAKNELHALAEKRGVDKQISWLGFLEQSEDVYAHIKASKVFVLPSKREGFGIVAIESNACGKPVLTANFNGNAAKDLVSNSVNGYVFEPTKEELSHAIIKTLATLNNLETKISSLVHKYSWNFLVEEQIKSYLL